MLYRTTAIRLIDLYAETTPIISTALRGERTSSGSSERYDLVAHGSSSMVRGLPLLWSARASSAARECARGSNKPRSLLVTVVRSSTANSTGDECRSWHVDTSGGYAVGVVEVEKVTLPHANCMEPN